METTIDRIYKVVAYKGDSIYKLSKKIGVSNGYFSKQRQGKGAISSNIIEKIVSYYLDIDADWLLTGKGSMFRSEAPANPAIPLYKDNQERVAAARPSNDGIPLIPLDAVAGFGTGEMQVLEYECERYIVPIFREAEFLIPVKGSSMIPKYNRGDLVACKKLPLNDLFFQWNKVYVLDTVQGALVKRIRKGCDIDHILLVSDNENYEPVELHKSQINAVALVIGVIRLE